MRNTQKFAVIGVVSLVLLGGIAGPVHAISGPALVKQVDAAVSPATVRMPADVQPGSRFYDDISWMYGRYITTGYADGTFGPQAAVTREAMAAFFFRWVGDPSYRPPAVPAFSDVPKSHKFYKEISWLKSEGIATGNAGGTFAPKRKITREAMAAFLHRYHGQGARGDEGHSFSDVPQGRRFSQEINWLKSVGITTGNADGTFAPKAHVTREAMAAFLHRYHSRFIGVDQ